MEGALGYIPATCFMLFIVIYEQKASQNEPKTDVHLYSLSIHNFRSCFV